MSIASFPRSGVQRAMALVAAWFFAGLATVSAQSSFQGLGVLFDDYAYSEAYAISGDGLTVVGTSTDENGDPRSFRWTAAGGMLALPPINPDWTYGEAHAVSYDGSVIVGEDYNLGSEDGGTRQGYRWTAGPTPADAGTTTGLPYADPDYSYGVALGVSADGSVIVGAEGGSYRPMRWTAEGGKQVLAEGYGSANGVSGDGSIVVGSVDGVAFRWTEADGVKPVVVPGAESSEAFAISADGTTVVGSFQTPDDASNGIERAFASTAAGVRVLNALTEGDYIETHAHAVSADGHWAVGHTGEFYAEIATLWDTTTGEVWDLNELFASTPGLEGWTLQFANGISADGLTIIGSGLNPNGDYEAWIGTLSAHPVPEPATCAALAGLGALGLAAWRRRSRAGG